MVLPSWLPDALVAAVAGVGLLMGSVASRAFRLSHECGRVDSAQQSGDVDVYVQEQNFAWLLADPDRGVAWLNRLHQDVTFRWARERDRWPCTRRKLPFLRRLTASIGAGRRKRSFTVELINGVRTPAFTSHAAALVARAPVGPRSCQRPLPTC